MTTISKRPSHRLDGFGLVHNFRRAILHGTSWCQAVCIPLTVCAMVVGLGIQLPALGLGSRPPVAVLEMPVVVEPGSEADAINNAGTLGGWTDYGPTLMPTIVDAWGRAEVLPILPDATDGQISMMNNAGEHIGFCLFCGGRRYMYWPGDGTVVEPPSYLGLYNVGIIAMNDVGVLGGFYESPEYGRSQPLLWEPATGAYTPLPDLDPNWVGSTAVLAINNANIAVGNSRLEGESITRAVLWENGAIRELPVAPYDYAVEARHINEGDVIVGIIFGAKSSGRSIAVWTPGADEVIALPDRWDRGDSYPQAINNRGIVIGTSRQQQSDNVNYYVWYSWYEQPLLIDNLFPPRHNWFNIKIWDINDADQIAGTGRKYGEPVGFVITPVTYSFRIRAAYPGRAGEVNAVQIEGAPPDTTIHLVAGTIGGGRYIPGCSSQQNALQIDNPQLVQSVITDATGHAVVRGRLPGSFAGQTLLLQAVIPGQCAISNLVEQTFE